MNASTAQTSPTKNGGGSAGAADPAKKINYRLATEVLAESPTEVQDRFEEPRAFLLALGDDVQEKTLKFYFSFKTIRNFACVEIRPMNKELLVFVKVDPGTVDLIKGFTRDVRNIGHFGTGNLEISLRSAEDLERAKPLLIRSYETA